MEEQRRWFQPMSDSEFHEEQVSRRGSSELGEDLRIYFEWSGETPPDTSELDGFRL